MLVQIGDTAIDRPGVPRAEGFRALTSGEAPNKEALQLAQRQRLVACWPIADSGSSSSAWKAR
jgi:hypothetical protein